MSLVKVYLLHDNAVFRTTVYGFGGVFLDGKNFRFGCKRTIRF